MARAPTTTTELMVISPCAKTSRTNPNSKSRARTDNGVSLSTKTASSRDLHFQRPFRIDRRHATCVQQPRHRVLAAHTKRFRGQELLSGDSPNKYLSRPRVWLCLRLRRPRFGQPEKTTLSKSSKVVWLRIAGGSHKNQVPTRTSLSLSSNFVGVPSQIRVYSEIISHNKPPFASS